MPHAKVPGLGVTAFSFSQNDLAHLNTVGLTQDYDVVGVAIGALSAIWWTHRQPTYPNTYSGGIYATDMSLQDGWTPSPTDEWYAKVTVTEEHQAPIVQRAGGGGCTTYIATHVPGKG